MSTGDPEVRVLTVGELDVATLYAVLRLRCDVFVVEQACAYPELDGRDLEPGARHLVVSDGDGVTATLRLLPEEGAHRIGRVATAPRARGRGLAARLVQRAVGLADSVVVLDAQAHLQQWYERFGFAVAGPSFVEDGIPHVPMRREVT